jgi:hypothetical protein
MDMVPKVKKTIIIILYDCICTPNKFFDYIIKKETIFTVFKRYGSSFQKKKEVWVNDNILNGAKGNHI